MRLMSWNINGIRAVDRKNAFDWFFAEQPDVLCVQEIKAVEEQIPERLKDVEGYHTFFNPAARKGYSGVGLYTKIKPKSVQNGFGIDKFDIEGRVQVADFGKFILFNIYYPNGKMSAERLQYKMDFYDAFLDYANDLKGKGKKLIICGDVNTAHKEIDLARPKENEKTSGFLPEERAWIDKFLAAGYIDTLRMFTDAPEQYTWWDYKTRARERNTGWRIDYFFISENLKKKTKAAFIRPELEGSDHCPIGIDVEI
ncbi:MAG: exodeoxyribonuclease III [Candidatus Zixiibacteriota bacterium]